jgi:hypothetical protein
MALDEGYRNVEVTMGPRPPRSSIGSSFQSEQDRSVRHVRISSNGTATFGVGGRQITVGEIIAHELAHGVVPPEVAPRRNWDVRNNSPEEVWVRRQTGAVAADLGLPGPDNADFPITEVPIDREQACTFNNIQGNTPRDGVLFLDGSRGSNGLGSASARRRSGSIDPGVNPVGAPGTAAGLGSFAEAPPNAAPPRPAADSTDDAPPIQPNPAARASVAPAAPARNQEQPGTAYPYSVPVPEELKPLARYFFPEWFERRNDVS